MRSIRRDPKYMRAETHGDGCRSAIGNEPAERALARMADPTPVTLCDGAEAYPASSAADVSSFPHAESRANRSAVRK